MSHFGIKAATAAAVAVPLGAPFIGHTINTPDAAPTAHGINAITSARNDTVSKRHQPTVSSAHPTSQDFHVLKSTDLSVPSPRPDVASVSPSSGQVSPKNLLLASSTRSSENDALNGVQAQALWGQSSGNAAANMHQRIVRGE